MATISYDRSKDVHPTGWIGNILWYLQHEVGSDYGRKCYSFFAHVNFLHDIPGTTNRGNHCWRIKRMKILFHSLLGNKIFIEKLSMKN